MAKQFDHLFEQICSVEVLTVFAGTAASFCGQITRHGAVFVSQISL